MNIQIHGMTCRLEAICRWLAGWISMEHKNRIFGE